MQITYLNHIKILAQSIKFSHNDIQGKAIKERGKTIHRNLNQYLKNEVLAVITR